MGLPIEALRDLPGSRAPLDTAARHALKGGSMLFVAHLLLWHCRGSWDEVESWFARRSGASWPKLRRYMRNNQAGLDALYRETLERLQELTR
jgi:hypothetical protein